MPTMPGQHLKGLSDMSPTPEQQIGIKEKFAARLRGQAVAIAVAVAAFLAASLLRLTGRGQSTGMAAGAVGMLVLAVVVFVPWFTFRNWRCPACAHFLGGRVLRSCRKCGAELW